MAYNEKSVTRVKHLKELAARVEKDYASKKYVGEQIAAVNHLTRKKVDSVDAIDLTAADADKYIYMVPSAGADGGNKYDEYMVIDGALEPMGNTSVDLSGYVEKEAGKSLSSNDFTDEDKEKLDGLTVATDEEVQEMLDDVFGTESEQGA